MSWRLLLIEFCKTSLNSMKCLRRDMLGPCGTLEGIFITFFRPFYVWIQCDATCWVPVGHWKVSSSLGDYLELSFFEKTVWIQCDATVLGPGGTEGKNSLSSYFISHPPHPLFILFWAGCEWHNRCNDYQQWSVITTLSLSQNWPNLSDWFCDFVVLVPCR